jgi:hypothetical protein
MRLTLFRQADLVLRGEAAPDGPSWRSRLGIVVAFGMFYGAVMGAYGGIDADRPWQMLYSAVKAPLLLTAAFGLSLPTFFVLNSLLGLRPDFPRVVRALVSAQAALTVVLASLAPITAFAYVSGIGYQPAILFNGLMFATASLSAQIVLRREYRGLIARNPAHRGMLRAWLCVYVFVGIQMGWVLRPFIGNPGSPVQFFREDSWSNAYLAVLDIAWRVVSGGR